MMNGADDAPLRPEVYGRDLKTELPMIARIADVEARIVFNLDSGDMVPANWCAIATEVYSALSDPEVDGVVVVHGTDTMAYSASAVALMLGGIPKPVVFTGAQRPLVDTRTDARENLIDALYVATLPVPEVSVVFSSVALRGVRSTKRDAWAFRAFDSPNCPPLVELGLGVEVSGHVRAAEALGELDVRLDARVVVFRLFPGFQVDMIRVALNHGIRGIVLEAYGIGNLPNANTDFESAMDDAYRQGVPIVVVSQCPRGFVELGRYGGGAAAKKAGAIGAGDMTVEAALAKLMIGLGRYSSMADISSFFELSRVGERAH